MSKMIIHDDDGFHVHQFLCLRLSHDPPYPMCERQCKSCFELDSYWDTPEMRARLRALGMPEPTKQ